MNELAHSVFMTAGLYAEAAALLNGSSPKMMIPSTVVAALSLELSFKALYLLELKKEFKVKGRHSHDFYRLFGELPPATRDELTGTFDAVIAARDMHDVRTVERHLGAPVPLDLPSHLKQWSTVFTELRYVYEFTRKSAGAQGYWLFYPEIHSVVSEASVKRGTAP